MNCVIIHIMLILVIASYIIIIGSVFTRSETKRKTEKQTWKVLQHQREASGGGGFTNPIIEINQLHSIIAPPGGLSNKNKV